MEHPEKILGVSFISNDQPAEVLQPEAEDVGGFGFEQGIVAGQVAFERVWFLETVWFQALLAIRDARRLWR
jgi:hypothetical protein